jgi:hypothetical protein
LPGKSLILWKIEFDTRGVLIYINIEVNKMVNKMKDQRNALQRLFGGSTLTPIQVTNYYQIYLRDLKKLKRRGLSSSNPYYNDDLKNLTKKIDDLLQAATEVYG